MVFGYLENGTYYFYVKESTGNSYLCDNSGIIRYDTGSPFSDQFGEYLKGKISAARYAVEFVDVIATNELQIGDSVPNWDESAIVPY